MKNRKNILFGAIAVMVMLIPSCGQAGFDVSLNIDDTDEISLDLLTSAVSVEAEIPISGMNLGIDLEKIIYNYLVTAYDTDTINTLEISIRLSLYGEDDTNMVLRTYDKTDNSSRKIWLQSAQENTVTDYNDGNMGWVYLVPPVSVSEGNPISATTTINSNSVINQILKQDTIWIVADISTADAVSTGNSFKITNQTIQAIGSKATGYYPGVF